MQAIVNHANSLKTRVENLASKYNLDRPSVDKKVVEYRNGAQAKFIALAVFVLVFVIAQVLKVVELIKASKYTPIVQKKAAPVVEKAQPHFETLKTKATNFYTEKKVEEKAKAFDQDYLLSTFATIFNQCQSAFSPKEESPVEKEPVVEEPKQE